MTKLYAPQDYQQASLEQRKVICNGCGPDGFVSRLVPNFILGVDVTEACHIHDWMTTQVFSLNERLHADSVFFANLKKLIYKAGGNRVLRWLRVSIARLYHYSVRLYSHAQHKRL